MMLHMYIIVDVHVVTYMYMCVTTEMCRCYNKLEYIYENVHRLQNVDSSMHSSDVLPVVMDTGSMAMLRWAHVEHYYSCTCE